MATLATLRPRGRSIFMEEPANLGDTFGGFIRVAASNIRARRSIKDVCVVYLTETISWLIVVGLKIKVTSSIEKQTIARDSDYLWKSVCLLSRCYSQG